jgi:phage gp29-like protein
MKKTKGITGQEQSGKLPGGGVPSIVVNQIDVRPFGRREQDIPSWRNALRSAESIIPRRLLLYDLYADVDLDAHVEAVTGKRRDAVTTANWQFVDKEGKPVDQINELIDSIGFNDMLEEIINSKFWGYSIMEPTFHRSEDGTWEMETNLIPRLNYRPEKGIVAYDYASDAGINIREGIYAKTIMEVGKPKDLGLYLKAAPFQILKRGGMGDWALFVQVFGNPIVDATWDGFDEQQRIKLLEAINALGSGGAIVRPAGTDITLLENKTNANGDLQDKFITLLNREISKALLGSTETTESSTSSGYAQAQTHAAQDERKNESDINFTRRVLNSRFIKILNAAGFSTQGGRFIVEGEDNELSVKESFDIHMQLKKEGIPIDDDFFYETYGIPKPDNYDQIVAEKRETNKKSQESRIKNQDNEDPDLREEEEEQENLTFAKRFIKLFSGFFGQAPEAEAEGAETVMTCCGSHRIIELAASDEPDFKNLLNTVNTLKGNGFIYPELLEYNVRALTKAFSEGWKSIELLQLYDLGIEYGARDPKMQTAWEMNLFKFSTVKAAYESDQVNRLFRNSKSFAEFERAVKKAYGVKNKNWLRTEYNTAYQTAEAASTYYRLMEQVRTFPYWQYKTIGDDRVRDAHRLLHDTVFPVMTVQDGKKVPNPVWSKIYPPNGWGCRCYVVPRMASEVSEEMIARSEAALAEFEKSAEWAKSRKSGFGINRAMKTEVFTEGQFYTKEPKKAENKAALMYAEEWGLPDILLAQQQYALTDWDNRYERDIVEEFIDRYRISNRKLEITDYAGRPIEMLKKKIEAHTNPLVKKYEDRHRYIMAIPEVLTDPHEVFLQNYRAGQGLDSYVFFKYYSNRIIKVIATLDQYGTLLLETWYPVELDPSKKEFRPLREHRKGIPIKI